jgi:hypothetical protein
MAIVCGIAGKSLRLSVALLWFGIALVVVIFPVFIVMLIRMT